jgi:hypothetical protein
MSIGIENRPHSLDPNGDGPDHLDPRRNEKKWYNKLSTKIAAGSLAAALAGVGGYAASHKGGEKVEAKPSQPPVATAPLSVETSAPALETPSAAAPVETDPKLWTEKNIPLPFDTNGDGKPETSIGVTGLEETLKSKMEQYGSAEEVFRNFPELLTAWVNWGNSPELERTYADFVSPDGERIGVAAAAELVDKAIINSIFGTPKNGAVVRTSPDGFIKEMIELRRKTGTRYAQTRDNEDPYWVKLTLDPTKGEGGIVITSGVPEQKLEYGGAYIALTSNHESSGLGSQGAGADGSVANKVDENKIIRSDIQMQDGRPVVISVNTDNY